MIKITIRAILAIALFSVLSPTAYTQQDDNQNRAETLTGSGQTDSATVAFEQALESAELRYNQSDTTVDLLFYQEGIPRRVYYPDYNAAAELYVEFLATAETTFGNNHVQVANILVRLAEAYRVLGRYYDAEPLLLRALKIREDKFGADHAAVAEILDQLGGIYFYYGDYPRSATYYDSGLTIREHALGIDRPEIAWSCLHLSNAIIRLNIFDVAQQLTEKATAIVTDRFGTEGLEMADCIEMKGLVEYWSYDKESAEGSAKKALEMRQRLLGPNHLQTADAIYNLANVHRFIGNPEIAESLFVEVLRVREKLLGSIHPEVAMVHHYMGLLYQYRFHDFTAAEASFRRGLEIREQALDSLHPDIPRSLYRLGEVCGSSQQLEKKNAAESFFTRALALEQTIHGKEHPQYIAVLTAKAKSYEAQGRFVEAKQLLEQRKELAAKAFGAVHPLVAEALSDLGFNLMRLGRFDEAEACQKKELSMREELTGPMHFGLAKVLSNMSVTYEGQGRSEEALQLLNRAKTIAENSSEGNDPEITASIYSNLGIVHNDIGKYDKAESFILKSMAMIQELFGKRNYQYAIGLLNLGLALEGQGRFDEADSVYRQSVEIGEVVLGPRNPGLAHALNNWANLSARMGRYDDAIKMQQRAVSILETALGPEHPEVSKFRRDQGRIYAWAGDAESSRKSFDKFVDWTQRYLENVFPYSSEEQKLRWIRVYPLTDNTVFSLALDRNDVQFNSLALEMLLKSKAMVIEAVMAEKQAAICHYDDAMLAQLDDLSEIHGLIASLSMAGGYYRDSVVSLYKVKDSLEVEISRHCSEFSDALAARRFELKDIAAAIPNGSVLWEFMRYEPVDLSPDVFGDDKLGDPRYLAFTMNQNGNITVNDLGNAATIDSLIATVRDLLYKAQGQIYSVAAVTAEQRLTEVTSRLYDMLFAPLDGDAKEIYVAPDGLLNLLPFEILPQPSGSYVIEDYHLSYLSSGRDLLKHKGAVDSEGAVFVLADPDFENTTIPVDTSGELFGPQMRGNTDCLTKSFNPLPFSRDEARSVINCFTDAGKKNVQQCFGTKAAEETLKDLTLAPSVLHLATHGFFCESNEAATALKDNPLLRSGLALAGANLTISGQPNDNGEDGILTALEVSGLNLVGTDLAVLSACESGVGDFVNGEGLFGLRRAFQHAGVETVVMSLWAIPDRETSQLMSGFYRRWLGGSSKRDALRESAIELLNASRDKRGCGHPLLWGGFILAGNPN